MKEVVNALKGLLIAVICIGGATVTGYGVDIDSVALICGGIFAVICSACYALFNLFTYVEKN